MNEDGRSLSGTIVDALKARNLTAGKLAEATGVSERFLESLIEERFDDLPPLPYVQGYLRRIADALSMDGDQLIREYLEDNELVRRSGKNDRLPANRFETPKLRSKIIISLLIVLAVLIYIIFKTPILGEAGSLTLYDLDNEITYTLDQKFTVSGEIGDSYKLTLNGERLYPDNSGTFSKEIELKEGFNTLVFETKKFLGGESTITKQIFYQTLTEEFNQNGEE